MGKATPENKVKKMVRAVLAEFNEPINIAGEAMAPMRGNPIYGVDRMKQFWPVPSGFGASDLDCIVCYYGVYIAIETKAPGRHPTPRQELTIAETKGAGGLVFVIEDQAGCEKLRSALKLIKFSHASNR